MAPSRIRSVESFLLAITAVLAGSGCNVIFGIETGEGFECAPSRPAQCDAASPNDPESCCTAGRSCQGGACVAGECTPVHAGDGNQGEAIWGVVLAGDQVVWATGSAIYGAPVGGGARRTLAQPPNPPFQYVKNLATDGANVYFADFDGSRIGRVAVSGGNVQVVAFVNRTDVVAGYGRIIVAGGHVYWAMQGGDTPDGKRGGIWRAPVTGAEVEAELVFDAPIPFGVAADDKHLYWSEDGVGILRVLLSDIGAGATPENIVFAPGPFGEFALDAQRVYWYEYTLLRSAPKNGGAIVDIHNDESSLWSVAADGHHVFWTLHGYDSGMGALRRAPVSGEGPVVTLVDGMTAGFGGIAHDCDTVFVGNNSTFELQKLAK